MTFEKSGKIDLAYLLEKYGPKKKEKLLTDAEKKAAEIAAKNAQYREKGFCVQFSLSDAYKSMRSQERVAAKPDGLKKVKKKKKPRPKWQFKNPATTAALEKQKKKGKGNGEVSDNEETDKEAVASSHKPRTRSLWRREAPVMGSPTQKRHPREIKSQTNSESADDKIRKAREKLRAKTKPQPTSFWRGLMTRKGSAKNEEEIVRATSPYPSTQFLNESEPNLDYEYDEGHDLMTTCSLKSGDRNINSRCASSAVSEWDRRKQKRQRNLKLKMKKVKSMDGNLHKINSFNSKENLECPREEICKSFDFRKLSKLNRSNTPRNTNLSKKTKDEKPSFWQSLKNINEINSVARNAGKPSLSRSNSMKNLTSNSEPKPQTLKNDFNEREAPKLAIAKDWFPSEKYFASFIYPNSPRGDSEGGTPRYENIERYFSHPNFNEEGRSDSPSKSLHTMLTDDVSRPASAFSLHTLDTGESFPKWTPDPWIDPHLVPDPDDIDRKDIKPKWRDRVEKKLARKESTHPPAKTEVPGALTHSDKEHKKKPFKLLRLGSGKSKEEEEQEKLLKPVKYLYAMCNCQRVAQPSTLSKLQKKRKVAGVIEVYGCPATDGEDITKSMYIAKNTANSEKPLCPFCKIFPQQRINAWLNEVVIPPCED